MGFTVTMQEGYGSDTIEEIVYTDEAIDCDRPDHVESAILFDSRYEYGELGSQVEPVWIDSSTAMALEEMGVLRLVGVMDGEIPQPVRVEEDLVFLYSVQA